MGTATPIPSTTPREFYSGETGNESPYGETPSNSIISIVFPPTHHHSPEQAPRTPKKLNAKSTKIPKTPKTSARPQPKQPDVKQTLIQETINLNSLMCDLYGNANIPVCNHHVDWPKLHKSNKRFDTHLTKFPLVEKKLQTAYTQTTNGTATLVDLVFGSRVPGALAFETTPPGQPDTSP